MNDDNTRRPTDLEAELLKNLGLCADQLTESHAECARHYPDFEVPLTEFRAAIDGAVAKYLGGLPEKNTAPSVDEIRRFVGQLKVLDLYLGLA